MTGRLSFVRADPDLSLQVLRYRTTQAYNTHYDYFTGGGGGDPNFNLDTYRNGSNRFVTMFIYMSDPTHGGQVHENYS